MKESLVQKEKNKSVIVQPKAVKTRLARTSRKQATPSQVTWTEEESERLLIEIKPNAKKSVVELANKPEGYQRSELIQVLGLNEQN